MLDGKLIRTIRKRLGISQSELTEMADLGANTLRRIELGQVNPNTATMQKIEEQLAKRILASEMTEEMEQLLTLLNVREVEPESHVVRDSREKLVLSAFYQLNDFGKEKVVEYTQDLAENPKYKKDLGNE